MVSAHSATPARTHLRSRRRINAESAEAAELLARNSPACSARSAFKLSPRTRPLPRGHPTKGEFAWRVVHGRSVDASAGFKPAPGRTAVRNAIAVFIWQEGDRFVQGHRFV